MVSFAAVRFRARLAVAIKVSANRLRWLLKMFLNVFHNVFRIWKKFYEIYFIGWGRNEISALSFYLIAFSFKLSLYSLSFKL